MNSDESNTPGRTFTVVAAAAAAVGLVTYLVLPDVPEPALPVMIGGTGTNYVAHGEYLTWRYPVKSELHTVGFEIMETTNLKTFRFAGTAIGTNLWWVPSNRPSSAFYTIGKTYSLAFTNAAVKRQ